MTAAQTNLYQQVVKVTQDYLGPAAERFVTRQIQTHLHKQPEQLTENDLAGLVDWIKVAIALLTEDGKMVDDFTNALLRLSNKQVNYTNGG